MKPSAGVRKKRNHGLRLVYVLPGWYTHATARGEDSGRSFVLRDIGKNCGDEVARVIEPEE